MVTISFRKTGKLYEDARPYLNGLAGNKDIFRNLSQLPHTRADWSGEPDDIVIRPTDFPKWREFIAGLPNFELFNEMLDALEADSDLWMDISY